MKLERKDYISIGIVAVAMYFAFKYYYKSLTKEKQINQLTQEKDELSQKISSLENINEERNKEIVSLIGQLSEEKENHKRQLEQNEKFNQQFISGYIFDTKTYVLKNLKSQIQFGIEKNVNEALENFCKQKLEEKLILNDYANRIK